MKTCSTCSFYSAIDPSAGNCRVSGGRRDQIVTAMPNESCGRHLVPANDDRPRLPAAA